MRVVILGAGITGLSLARRLLLSCDAPALRVTVLEKEAVPGGLCRTLDAGGFRFDQGPHNFHSRTPGFHDAMRELLGDRYRERSFTAQVVFRGRFIPYPMSGMDVLRSIPLTTSLACGASFLGSVLANRSTGGEESFEQFIVRRFGRKMYGIYFGPFTRKVWGVDGSDISADFGRERIGSYNLWDLFKRLFLGIRQKGRVTAENPFNEIRRFYPPSGCGELIDELLRRCSADPRFTLRTRSEATGLETDGGRVTAVRLGDDRLPGDRFVSTIPLPELGGFLGGPVGRLTYTSTAFLMLFLDRPRVLGPSPWVLFADPAVPFNRVSELGLICEEMNPPGKTCLIVEHTYPEWSETASVPDGDLFRRAVEGLSGYGLIAPGDVEDWTMIRRRGTHPLRRLGYAVERDALSARVAAVPNLETLGRQGTFAHMNMDTCFLAAEAAAVRLAAGIPRS